MHIFFTNNNGLWLSYFRPLLFAFLLGFFQVVNAQNNVSVKSARSVAMGGAYVALDDIQSSFDNMASLAFVQGCAAVMSYRQDYLLSGLATKSLAAGCSVSSMGTVALRYSHYGRSAYNEQSLSLGYAQGITPSLSIGVAVYYLYSGTSNPLFDASRTISADVSVYYAVARQWAVGFRVYNPFLSSIDFSGGDKLPSVLEFGFSYKPLSGLTTTVDINKNYFAPISVRIGAEYLFASFLAARIGFCTSPVKFTFGAAVLGKRYSIDFAASVHQLLGLSPCVSISYHF